MKTVHLLGLLLPLGALACSDDGANEAEDAALIGDAERADAAGSSTSVSGQAGSPNGQNAGSGSSGSASEPGGSADVDFGASDDGASGDDDAPRDEGDFSADDTVAEGDPADGPTTDEQIDPDDREFDAPGTNPFVLVEHDPLSTFAADVDTASYDIFRKDLGEGRLPPPNSVRLEEYINFFDYDYSLPSAESEHPFAITLAAAPSLVDNGTQLLRVGIAGKELSEADRRPANLVFLVDVSGSMAAADKLPVVKTLMIEALATMAPEDTISIVTYAGSTGVALEPTAASDQDTIIDTISDFESGGGTAGAAGIDLAYAQAAAGYIEGGVNHVVLCSDGDFNVGISDQAELVAFIEEKRQTGITFTALGFGSGNLNDAVMESISNAGNGTYAVIGSDADAQTYAKERFFASMQFIAKDVKLQVEFNPELVLAYRLLGYENRAIADEDFRNDVVDAGELGSGHRMTALYEIVLHGSSIPQPEGAPLLDDGEAYTGEREVAEADLVYVKVRYKDIDATALDDAYEVGNGLAAEALATSHSELDDDFQWAFGMALFAEIIKQSPFSDVRLMPQLQNIFEPQAQRDAARADFVSLFASSAELLGVSDLPPLATDGGVVEAPDTDGGVVEAPDTDGGVVEAPDTDGGAPDAG